jgi:hypothetical protein
MITIEKSRSWTGVAILIAIVVAGVLGWWALAPKGAVLDPEASGQAGPIWQWSPSTSSPGSSAPTTSILSDARWANVNSQDQATLEASLSQSHLNAKVEAARIVSYVQYHMAFEAWQGLDAQNQQAERRQMAESLFKELPDRLKSGEFTLMESALMGAVLIADSEADEARRNQRVEAWQSQLATIVPNPEDETLMATQTRETEYMRRRATAFSEWQGQSDPSLRTPAKLEQAMVEINRAYASGQ